MPRKSKKLANKLRASEKEFYSRVKSAEDQATHNSAQGSEVEDLWIEFLKKHLPCRYTVSGGFVGDSKGNVSDQIDCIIYDALYTPRLYGGKNTLCVPAEAVYAIFEIKPSVNKGHIEYACKKANSVRSLHRKSAPVVIDRGEVHASRKMFKIVGGLLATSVDNQEATIKKHFGMLELDCILAAGKKQPSYWDKFDGSISSKTGQCALIAGVFRLLHNLQKMGTVAPIDWKAYEEAIGYAR